MVNASLVMKPAKGLIVSCLFIYISLILQSGQRIKQTVAVAILVEVTDLKLLKSYWHHLARQCGARMLPQTLRIASWGQALAYFFLYFAQQAMEEALVCIDVSGRVAKGLAANECGKRRLVLFFLSSVDECKHVRERKKDEETRSARAVE